MSPGVSRTASINRKTPPYSKTLKALNGAVWIYCGKRAWKVRELQKGLAQDCSLVFPADKPPAEYDWPVRNAQVFIVALDIDLMLAAQLVLCCLDAHATEVLLIHDGLKNGLVRYAGRGQMKRCA